MSYRIIISGTGPTPSIVTETDGVTPPVVPPVVPPVTPPEDDSPYDWPAGGPNRPAYDYERTSWWWKIPGRADDDPSARMYAMAESAGNPAGVSHRQAGIIARGPQAGQRLWAPTNAPPAMIRQIITTGVWP